MWFPERLDMIVPPAHKYDDRHEATRLTACSILIRAPPVLGKNAD